MEVNSFIFSPPSTTEEDLKKIKEHLVWVPVYCSGRLRSLESLCSALKLEQFKKPDNHQRSLQPISFSQPNKRETTNGGESISDAITENKEISTRRLGLHPRISFEKPLFKKLTFNHPGMASINSLEDNKSYNFSNPFLSWMQKQKKSVHQSTLNSEPPLMLNGTLKKQTQANEEIKFKSKAHPEKETEKFKDNLRSSINHAEEHLEGKRVFYLPQPKTMLKKKLSINSEVKRLGVPEEKNSLKIQETSTSKIKIICPNTMKKAGLSSSVSLLPNDSTKISAPPANDNPLRTSTCLPEFDEGPDLSIKLMNNKDGAFLNSHAVKNQKLFEQTPSIQREGINHQEFENMMSHYSRRVVRSIPCIYISRCQAVETPLSSKASVILYFHANAEDLATNITFLKHIVRITGVPAFSMEYPGYSIYSGVPSEEQIFEDGEHVFNFLTSTLKISSERILILGRSLGSAVASHVCTKFSPLALVLLSPLASTARVAGEKYGALVKVLIKDRFNNVDMAAKVTCPTLIIHGEKDDIIDPTQPKEISSRLFLFQEI